MLKSQVERLKFIRNVDIIVGIDIAKETHWVRIISPYGLEFCKPFPINNNIIDFKLLEQKINDIKFQNHLEKVIIGMEPTGSYGSALINFLISVGFYVVNVMSNHVKKAKELDDNTPTKNDRKDALTIANLIKEGRYHDIYIPKGIYADLRILTTNRQEWIRNKVHCNNKIICILDQYFPEFQSVFKDISGKGAMQILSKYPLPEDILSVDIETIRDNTKVSNGKRRIPKKKIVALYTFAQNTIGITNDISYVKTNIKFLIDEYKNILKNLEYIESQMSQALSKLEETKYITSIKGISDIFASDLIGELGNISRFQNWKQIRKYAGYNFKEESSGKKKGQTVITKRGRPFLRYTLYQIALSLVSNNNEFKQLFEYFKTRKKNPLKGSQALVAVAMKFLRVVHYLVINKEKYNFSRVLGEYREQQIAA